MALVMPMATRMRTMIVDGKNSELPSALSRENADFCSSSSLLRLCHTLIDRPGLID
eukprot:CAMPEP_0119548264 /NCGR_PEP_ID=MMETSP1352-20130426/2218_1 /TAXON_ID=265584 /ORGANISM="Stauroneis constricta, Strain CCMP1120" /LENGTH=55 /DNA_ID=CAMNT_0007593479 /DNA_START=291 /DNA_END=455 /DNA_ORIENTATION=-